MIVLKLLINVSVVVLLLSASTNAIAQSSANNGAVGGSLGLQQVPAKPARAAQVGNSGIARPIVVSQGTNVKKVFDWIEKNKNFQRGPEWKTASETSLIFYVPHDNLRFRIEFSSETEAIARMMVGFGGFEAGPCELRIAKLSLHQDTSYSIEMLPLHQRPYAVRPSKGESILSPIIPQARKTETETEPSLPLPAYIDQFR